MWRGEVGEKVTRTTQLTAREWREAFSNRRRSGLSEWLEVNYGSDPKRNDDRASRLLNLLGYAEGDSAFDPSRPMVLGRTPCRARVFGGHTDIKGCGGYLINMAGNLEMMYVGQARGDRKIVLRNMNPHMSACEFSRDDWDVRPGDGIQTPEDWDRWCTDVERHKKEELRSQAQPSDAFTEKQFSARWNRFREEEWQEFVKGLIAFLQTAIADPHGVIQKKLGGFTCLFWSEVPMGWGLSSSSALVLSIAKLTNNLHGLGLSDDQIVNLGLCEHYNGTKGGMNDHASIINGVGGKILLMQSFPEKIVDTETFPGGASLFLVDSTVKRSQAPMFSAKLKREGVADVSEVLARTGSGYVLGSLWVRHHFPEYREALTPRPETTNDTNGLLREFNRDGSIRFPGESQRIEAVCRVLQSMPARVTRDELLHVLPEFENELEAVFLTHLEPKDGYQLRGLALYGLAENERGFEYMSRAREGDFRGLLELMRFAQDGDRVARFLFDELGNVREEAFDPAVSDQDLERWGKDPEDHPIWRQPGEFGRSIEPVDELCDLITHQFGEEAAARVAGAGLGGAVTVLAKSESVPEIRSFLQTKGYPSIPPLTPSNGASVVSLG